MNRFLALPACILLGCSTGAAHAAAARAVADTWVYGASGFQDTNFGANPTIRVRTSGTRIGLVRFDTNALPTGGQVLLKMRVSTVNVGGLVRIHVVQQPWQEKTVTFKTRPAFSSADVSTRNVLPSDVGQIVSFDVTSAVTGWRANPASNFGLAIDARESRAEVFFASREGGTAPLLEGIGGVVRDGDVTVSKSGGDYTSPIAAAENAVQGDHWCTMPLNGCTMRIDAGVFILPKQLEVPIQVNVVGHGKGETLLTGSSVRMDGPTITDLSIIVRADSTTHVALVTPNDGTQVMRVSLLIEGPGDNIGIDGGFGTSVFDSEIVVLGGDHTKGHWVSSGGGFRIVNSSIRVAGASQQAIGIEWDTDDGGLSEIVNTVVSVEAPGSADGMFLNAEAVTEISGSRFFVRSDTRATAISSPITTFADRLEVRDTVLSARGPDGEPAIAVDYGPTSANRLVFDHVTAEGAIRVAQDSTVDIRITRSQISALEVHVAAPADLSVVLDETSIRNGVLLDSATTGTLAATSSILGAPRTFTNISASCTEVYDENLQLLPANCGAP